jgi:thiol-disulfide isomerase/thioredoxin
LLLASCSASVPPSAKHPRLGFPALFTLPAETGELTSVPEAPPAKATVVAFWATSCEPCQQRVAGLAKQAERWNADGVSLVLVAVLRPDETADSARSTLASWGAPRPFLVDRQGEVDKVLGVDKLPAIWVLDAGGTLRWAAPEQATAEQVGAAAKRVATEP